MALQPDFQHTEDAFFQLKGQLATGRLTPEQFTTALNELVVRDAQGRYWMMGSETGSWYRFDGAQWLPDDPSEAAPTASLPALRPAAPVASPSPAAGVPAVASVPRPAPVAAPVRYGGFVRRLTAWAIDTTILALLLILASGYLQRLAGSRAVIRLLHPLTFPLAASLSSSENLIRESDINTLWLSLAVGLAYFVGCWTAFGRTPGKLLLGMKITTREGRRIGLMAALVRYVGYFISGALFALGFFWIALDRKNQGWHDKLARTYVVRT
jgi:uncharacterized RDD family membrane protein YckC